MNTTRPASPALRRPSAITWVGSSEAVLARRAADGTVTTRRIRRLGPIEDELTFLARVSHELGPDDDLLVLGLEPERTVFERMDVAIHHRPERLTDGPELATPPAPAELAAQLDG